MIASSSLLDSTLTAGTLTNTILIFRQPHLEFFAHSFIAADVITVPNFFAGEADLCLTFRASELLYLVIVCTHVGLAVCLWAPSDKRIRL